MKKIIFVVIILLGIGSISALVKGIPRALREDSQGSPDTAAAQSSVSDHGELGIAYTAPEGWAKTDSSVSPRLYSWRNGENGQVVIGVVIMRVPMGFRLLPNSGLEGFANEVSKAGLNKVSAPADEAFGGYNWVKYKASNDDESINIERYGLAEGINGHAACLQFSWTSEASPSDLSQIDKFKASILKLK